MNTILVSFLALIQLFAHPNENANRVSIFDLDGVWNVTGYYLNGNVDYDIRLEVYGDELYVSEVSRYGYGDKSREVLEFSHYGNSVRFKISGDDGIGAWTRMYKLKVVNNNLLSGTVDSRVAGWGGLPPIVSNDRVTLRRK